jgi:hypothetical protein
MLAMRWLLSGMSRRGMRLSFIRSLCSRPLAIFHRVTRPSVEMDTSVDATLPVSVHFSFHTGSWCLPGTPYEVMLGSKLRDLTSYTAMCPE